ncbi:hypothetical protein pb186bvf_014709 [Paramecium bursaria]
MKKIKKFKYLQIGILVTENSAFEIIRYDYENNDSSACIKIEEKKYQYFHIEYNLNMKNLMSQEQTTKIGKDNNSDIGNFIMFMKKRTLIIVGLRINKNIDLSRL